MAPVTITIDDPELIAAILSDAEVVGCPWYLDDLCDFILDAERAQGQTHSYGDGCEPAHDAVEPWNHVTFGDGTTGWLRPFGSYNEILNDDGSIHCNHGDHVNCVRTDHTTRITYYVDPEPAAVHEPAAVQLEQPRTCTCGKINDTTRTSSVDGLQTARGEHWFNGNRCRETGFDQHSRPTIPADRLDG